MLYEKSIQQSDPVSRLSDCHEETGALGSYLAKKEQQHRSKDMLDKLPTINTRSMRILRNRNYHYEACHYEASLIMSRSYSDYQFIKERNYDM